MNFRPESLSGLLITVLEKEQIGFHQCIGFGDNNNDLEILSEVETSVAVGNGSEQLKQKVDYITDDIADDGVYKALVKFGLIWENWSEIL